MTERRGTDVINGAKAYRRLNVETRVDEADPHELIRMMFDGALARLARAKGCAQHGDIEERGKALDGALAIIGGLQGSLDRERGGELAENLDSLYDYMQRRIFRAIADQDTQPIDEVTGLIRTLKEAWEAIDPDGIARASSQRQPA